MTAQPTVLVVAADVELPILAAQLDAEGFIARSAASGAEALALARRERPAAIAAKVLLADLDGFALCWEVKRDPALRSVPVVLVDDLSAGQPDRAFGQRLGAAAVLDRSAAPAEIGRALRDALAAAARSARLPRDDEVTMLREDNRRLVDALGRRLRQVEDSAYRLRSYAGHLRQANLRLQEAYLATLEALAGALDVRDAYTHSHSRAVAAYAVAIGRELELPVEELDLLHWAGLLHDIGKIGIPDAVLQKAGKPTEAEWRVIRTHPDVGHRMLSPLKFLKGALPAVRHHQERFDGNGYPSGLCGAAIPLPARILAVADALHAMTSQRPYRPPMTMAAAAESLRAGRGTQFDPAVVDACLRVLARKAAAGPPYQPATSADETREVH